MQMPQEDLRKAQLLMLKILKEVHRVCEENNIKYFLSDGTLIGAVRHNGFIPWDDDADIGMLREEYEKFCKIAPEKLGEEFFFQTTETDPGYGFQFGKVLLKGTKWIEVKAKKTKRLYEGIFVDIFPYDKIPQNIFIQKIIREKYKFINTLIMIKLNYTSIRFVRGVIRKLYYGIRIIISLCCKKTSLLEERNKICTRYQELSKNFFFTKYGGDFFNNQNKCSVYENYKLQLFEGEYFYIPIEYDSILTKLYGEYMQLPPIEKRNNHGVIEYDFGTYM